MKKFLLLFLCSIAVIVIAACSSSASQTSQIADQDENYFLISLPKESWEPRFPVLDGEVNIFQTNLDGSSLWPIVTGLKGYNYVIDLSPNRNKFLFASFETPRKIDPEIVGSLFVFDLETSDVTKLSESYPYNLSLMMNGALWLSNDEIAFISSADGSRFIHTIQTDGNGAQIRASLNQFDLRLPPLRLLAFQDDKNLYWQNGQFDSEGVEISVFPMRAELNGQNFSRVQTRDGSSLSWEIAPAGNLIVWGKEIITNDFDLVERLELDFEPSRFVWSPNGDRLLIQTCSNNSCSETVNSYLWQQRSDISPQIPIDAFKRLEELPINSEVLWVVWSPNQTEILFLLPREETSAEIDSLFGILNLDTLETYPAFEEINIESGFIPLYVQWLNSGTK